MTAIIYDLHHGAAWITLNRPDNRNALSAQLVNELYAHLKQANEDANVRAIVLTGNGPAFCAGADLKSPPGSSISGEESVPYADVLKAILASPKPVIAAVNGAAFAGGLGLIGAADIVITDADALFSFSEVRIGVIPAVISVVCMPKLGRHHAMKLFITGERFTGDQAVTMGLAHRAVSASELKAAVEEELEMINLGGPMAVQACKALVNRVPTWEADAAFDEASTWSVATFQSDEAAEGMAAFREKRSPSWVED